MHAEAPEPKKKLLAYEKEVQEGSAETVIAVFAL